MNLMFRKNFGGGKSGGGGGGVKLGKINPNRSQGKRSRDMGYSQSEEVHYRTHLFFVPARSNFQNEQAEGC